MLKPACLSRQMMFVHTYHTDTRNYKVGQNHPDYGRLLGEAETTPCHVPCHGFVRAATLAGHNPRVRADLTPDTSVRFARF